MRLVRTILALVIALSLAMLPTAGSTMLIMGLNTLGTADVASTMVGMTMPAEMSMANHDCCLDHTKAKPGDRSGDQCPMAVCATQVLSAVLGASLNSPILAGCPLPLPADQIVSLHG